MSKDRLYFRLTWQSGSGDDWVQREATVMDAGKRFVLYTNTNGLNSPPRYYADMGKAITDGMAFVQAGEAPRPAMTDQPSCEDLSR